MRAAPVPISAKRMAQTMGKRRPGGESGGLTSIEPYDSILFRVSQPERAPTASVSRIQNRYDLRSVDFMFITRTPLKMIIHEPIFPQADENNAKYFRRESRNVIARQIEEDR